MTPGAKEVSIRATNKCNVRATLVLCCFADGIKLPPMLIFKESSGKLSEKLINAYDSRTIVIKANAKGWVNKALMSEWVKDVWVPNIKKDVNSLLVRVKKNYLILIFGQAKKNMCLKSTIY